MQYIPEKYYLHTVLNNKSLLFTKILKLTDECQRRSKPNHCRFSMTEKTKFPGFIFMFHQLVQSLVRKGGITNHHLIVYFLSNTSAKNYQNWFTCIDVIVCNISVIL